MYDFQQKLTDVLCPGLYGRLCSLFGTVEVTHQGEPMQAQFVYDPYRQRSRLEGAMGEYYHVNCCFCGDTRKRLWINHAYGQKDDHGRPMKFLAVCYNETRCLDSYRNQQKLYEQITGGLPVEAFRVQPARAVPPPVDPREPPGDIVLLRELPRNHPAVVYMLDVRGYSEQLVEEYQIAYCVRAYPHYAPAANKIVFPIFMGGELQGWQCRRIDLPGLPEDASPKYYTKPRMHKSKILFNLDKAAQGPFAVVAEGVMHVLRVPTVGVAVLGSYVSPWQEQAILQSFRGRPIILSLDNQPDVQVKQQQTAATLRTWHDAPVLCLSVATQDIADYTTEAMMAFFQEGIRQAC